MALIICSQDKVRSQDTVFVIGSVTGSKLGRDAAWKFVTENWQNLKERYSGGFLLARLIKVGSVLISCWILLFLDFLYESRLGMLWFCRKMFQRS